MLKWFDLKGEKNLKYKWELIDFCWCSSPISCTTFHQHHCNGLHSQTKITCLITFCRFAKINLKNVTSNTFLVSFIFLYAHKGILGKIHPEKLTNFIFLFECIWFAAPILLNTSHSIQLSPGARCTILSLLRNRII